jgi:hypothetical protein
MESGRREICGFHVVHRRKSDTKESPEMPQCFVKINKIYGNLMCDIMGLVSYIIQRKEVFRYNERRIKN